MPKVNSYGRPRLWRLAPPARRPPHFPASPGAKNSCFKLSVSGYTITIRSIFITGGAALIWLGLILLVVALLGLGGLALMVSQSAQPLPATPEQERARGYQLIEAAQKGDEGLLQALLRSSPDLEVRDNQGLSALHWAAKNGHLHAVELLLKAGQNPRWACREGQTPLHEAVLGADRARMRAGFDESQWVKVIHALMHGGADPHTVDRWGTSALVHAQETGMSALVNAMKDAMAKQA